MRMIAYRNAAQPPRDGFTGQARPRRIRVGASTVGWLEVFKLGPDGRGSRFAATVIGEDGSRVGGHVRRHHYRLLRATDGTAEIVMRVSTVSGTTDGVMTWVPGEPLGVGAGDLGLSLAPGLPSVVWNRRTDGSVVAVHTPIGTFVSDGATSLEVLVVVWMDSLWLPANVLSGLFGFARTATMRIDGSAFPL
jgi:hypothetical protein